MGGALDGIRVVDLSTVLMGPWATQMMGDMGADVIKVETPAGDITRKSGLSLHKNMASFFMGTNRNKRSIVLDLTLAEGREALFKLVGSADVFLHNLRPTVAAKFQLEYEQFAERYPQLIYCACCGFRKDGPWANKPVYDDIIQAASGLTDLQTVIAGEPRFIPTVMADKVASYNVLSGILAALLHRQRGGSGQAVEVAMFETLVDFVMVEHLYGAVFEPPIGPGGYQRLLNSKRKPFLTSDDQYLAVMPYSDENWRALFTLAGRTELIRDARFIDIASRIEFASEAYGILAEIIATRSAAEWEKDLDAANIPAILVNTLEQLIDNAQLKACSFWHILEHPTEGTVRMTDPTVRFSKTPSSIQKCQPLLGEHSIEVLAEAGFSIEKIDQLLVSGAVHQHDNHDAT